MADTVGWRFGAKARRRTIGRLPWFGTGLSLSPVKNADPPCQYVAVNKVAKIKVAIG